MSKKTKTAKPTRMKKVTKEAKTSHSKKELEAIKDKTRKFFGPIIDKYRLAWPGEPHPVPDSKGPFIKLDLDETNSNFPHGPREVPGKEKAENKSKRGAKASPGTTQARRCPKCKSGKAMPIMYGYPDPEMMKDAEAGKMALGGCIWDASNPSWECKHCGHTWGNLGREE